MYPSSPNTQTIFHGENSDSPAQQLREFKQTMGQLRRQLTGNRSSHRSRTAKLCKPFKLIGEALDVCEESFRSVAHADLRPDQLKTKDEEKLRRWAENACEGNARTMRSLRGWFDRHSPSLATIEVICRVLADRLVRPAAESCGEPVSAKQSQINALHARLNGIRSDPAGQVLSHYFIACWLHGVSVVGPLSAVAIANESSLPIRAQQRIAFAASLFPGLELNPKARTP